jgi:cob(I)alamin adenosyltransferase
VAEALGSLDETNSFLGLARARTNGKSFEIEKKQINFADIILEIQQNLFIVQAEVAGSAMSISSEKIQEAEHIVDEIEKVLPPIKSFFISGATKDGKASGSSQRRRKNKCDRGDNDLSESSLQFALCARSRF